MKTFHSDMKKTLAKYYKDAKLVHVTNGNWTLTAKVLTRGHLCNTLYHHRLKLVTKWEDRGGILHAEVRRA